MSQYNFGVGTIIGTRTDIANAQPAFFGVAQDFEVDFDRSVKELIGQYQFPVAIAAGQFKITGKCKFARIQMSTINNLFIGETMTTGTQTLMPAQGEPHTPSGTTQQVTNHATFVADLGVAYASSGILLQPVASGPTVGQYSVVPSTGTYTFNASDEVPLLFYYSYTVSTGFSVPITNELMGIQPNFSINMQQQFSQFGATKTIFLTLNACVSNKLTFPFKNQDFTLQEMDFQAFADANNNIGNISTTE